MGFRVRTTRDAGEVAAECNLIGDLHAVAEPAPDGRSGQARHPYHGHGLRHGREAELDPAILGMADRVVVDSLSQARLRGECFKAFEAGAIAPEDVVELGAVVEDGKLGRTSDDDITIADLTGVAVQDIQIAKAVWTRFVSIR